MSDRSNKKRTKSKLINKLIRTGFKTYFSETLSNKISLLKERRKF